MAAMTKNKPVVVSKTESKTIAQALKNSIWRKAMDEEITSLTRKNICNMVPPSHFENVIGCK